MKVDYTYLRPLKSDAVRDLHNNIKKNHDIAIESIKNGIVLPVKRCSGDKLLFGRGGCITETGQYIDISGIPERLFGSYEFGTVEKNECTVMYCGYLVPHWGHFLIEAITRLWLVLEMKDIDYFVFITEIDAEYSLQGNYREVLQALGILDKILIINKPTMFHKIIIPDRAYKRMESYSDKFSLLLDYISDKALSYNTYNHIDNYPKKIYLSRNRLYSKKKKENIFEYGLDMLDEYFEKNGYYILYPEKIPFCEMIAFIKNAEICASESGSAAHNLLFANQGGTIEIVERQVYPNEFQADIDVIKNFSTTYIDAYYSLYPTGAAGGPYLLFYSDLFKRFTRDKKYSEPCSRFMSSKYKKEAIKWYIRSYHVHSGYRLALCEDMLNYPQAYYEAIAAANEFFASCLPPKMKQSEKIFIVRHFPQILMRKILGDKLIDCIKRKLICLKSV